MVPNEAHSRTVHIMHQGIAAAGFWTHGLWPWQFKGVPHEFCSSEQFLPSALGPFQQSLAYYVRQPFPNTQAASQTSFWFHEWSKHGTCSNMDQLSYFMASYRASSLYNKAVLDALSASKITPSNTKPYTMLQLKTSLSYKFGKAFSPSQGMTCALRNQTSPRDKTPAYDLAEIRLCLNQTSLALLDCSRLSTPLSSVPRSNANLTVPDRPSLPCPSDPNTVIFFTDFTEGDSSGASIPWSILLIVGSTAIGCILVVALIHQLLQKWSLLPPLFLSRPVTIVYYDKVHQPVDVLSIKLDMEDLKVRLPSYHDFCKDLPVGMGIKGGIARKLLKEFYGTPEPPGSFDIDVLVFVDEYTPASRIAAREAAAGMKLGTLTLMPQDIEVLTKGFLPEYFITRDITMNEVLILRTANDSISLFYTRDAKKDVSEGRGIIRPSIHALRSEFNPIWELEDNGTPFMAGQQVIRSLIRFLKGHGEDYAFDEATWVHFRSMGLSKIQLFKVLRPFHDNDLKMIKAIDHLLEIGFLSRADLRKAGGVNMLWGLLLQEVNAMVARHGGRMTLTELDPEAVERWVEHKKATIAATSIATEMRARRTGFCPSEESVVDLGLLHFPPELSEFIASGPIFYSCRSQPASQPLSLPALSSSSSSSAAAAVAATAGESSGWLRASNLKETVDEDSPLGTFYQLTNPEELEGVQDQYVPLVSDKEQPQKRRVEIFRLLRFVVGVMAIEKEIWLLSFILMLTGLLFRLCGPAVESSIFDAFNDLDPQLFKHEIKLWLLLVLADVALTLAGSVAMELFARKAMQTLFRRFFEHIIYQDLPFFERLSPGELMARTSGDSLTLRSLVTASTFQLLEGFILFIGGLALIIVSSNSVVMAQPAIILIFLLVIAGSIGEALAVGHWLRQCNQSVRKSLGSLFGFTLDAFSKISTVSILGLEGKMEHDYNLYSKDYFSSTFIMNASSAAHTAFTYFISACLISSLLHFGGGLLLRDLTTVGSLLATLRYVHLSQSGLRQASSAFARIAGGLGSVERIVELHDRGVFRESFGLGSDEEEEARLSELNARGGPSLFRTRSEAARLASIERLRGQDLAEESGLRQPLIPPPLSISPSSVQTIQGVRLTDIHLAMRSRTDHLLLNGLSMEVKAGHMALILGSDSSSKSRILSVMMLKMMPCKGNVSYLTKESAAWTSFDFRRDDAAPYRRHIGFSSASSVGIFRTSIEDNIAVAAPDLTTGDEVRRVAQMVGLHDEIMTMSDGYRTLVGDGSGTTLSRATALRIGLARALIRRPKLLLIDDAELFMDALGTDRFHNIVSSVVKEGAACVMCYASTSLPPLVRDGLNVQVHEFRDGVLINR